MDVESPAVNKIHWCYQGTGKGDEAMGRFGPTTASLGGCHSERI